MSLVLNSARLLKGCKCTVLLDVTETLYGYVYGHYLPNFWYENATALDIGLTAHLSYRVELGSTRTVRVPSAYLCALACDAARL